MVLNDYDAGKHYPAVWIFIIIISFFGFIFHSFILYLFNKTEIFWRPGCRVKAGYALVIVAMTYCFYELIKSLINYSHNKFVGGELFCSIDAAINVFLFEWMYIMIVLMSEVVQSDFTIKPIQNKEYLSKMFILGLYSALIGILCVILPDSIHYLDETGIYCFIDFHSIVSIVVFIGFGIIIPTIYLIYNLHITQNKIKIAHQLLTAEGIHSQDKIKKFKFIKTTIKSLIIFGIIQTPNIIAALYYTITNHKPSLYLNVIGTNLYLFYLLFFAINVYIVVYELQDTFHLYYNDKIEHIIRIIKGKSNKIDITYKINDIKYNNWKFWYENSILKTILMEMTEKFYVIENFQFYEEIIIYKNKGNNIIKLIKLLNINILNNNEIIKLNEITKRNEIKRLWIEMNEHANYIYKLYIKIPTAPLEINIPDKARQQIYEIFEFSNNQKSENYNQFIPLFCDLLFNDLNNIDISINLVIKYMNGFDLSFEAIQLIIETSIFPRFKNSKIYQKTIDMFDESNESAAHSLMIDSNIGL